MLKNSNTTELIADLFGNYLNKIFYLLMACKKLFTFRNMLKGITIIRVKINSYEKEKKY